MTTKTARLFVCSTAALALLALAPTAWAGDDTAPGKVKPYPLKTCLVSGEKLGEMGEPHVINYHGQEIKFCCKGCVKDFNKDPDKYLRKLAQGNPGQKNASGQDHR